MKAASATRWFALLVLLALPLAAEDGYRLWLRYNPIPDPALREAYRAGVATIVLETSSGADSPTLAAAREELTAGCRGLLDIAASIQIRPGGELPSATGDEGFALRSAPGVVTIAARRDVGVLYGAFALLRHLQAHRALAALDQVDAPRIRRRLLNHWDNLNGTIERGYAGRSLWRWSELPGKLDPRYRDYARACASLGLNGTVLTNVNANAQVLTADYLRKVAALAGVFRPYGLRVYLTARFSAPLEIGKLPTADPQDPAVAAWWRAKADEIYAAIPDFGGFVVKANSEGQPGPQNYHRSHAEGANVLADALAPHGGIVIWRAFVYDANDTDDRHKQAYTEFRPLDGQFRPNVIVQVKNGAIDFMPREPFHPLFGAMPRTPLALEVQITQEYLGGSGQLAFLAPMWREVLDAETGRPAAGTRLAAVADGTAEGHPDSAIAGVANTGSDRNWCGHVLAAANWYAYGRLAWNHQLSSETLAEEWTRLTFSNDPRVLDVLTGMLLASRETVVNYSMPLGLHHIMARDHHQGPGPWVTGGRADWTAPYYHQADATGLGFDRTNRGSGALGQYAPELARRWGDPQTCPEEFLLWFHHVPWDHRMKSGRTLWDELCRRYQSGVNDVRGWQRQWATLRGTIDDGRFRAVTALLARQEREARIWRDACIQYFATFARRPVPADVEPPEHPLAYFRKLRTPFSAEMK